MGVTGGLTGVLIQPDKEFQGSQTIDKSHSWSQSVTKL